MPHGIRVAEGQLTNAHLSGGTFSVNGVQTPIGGNINITVEGSATIDTSTLDFDNEAYPGQIVADVRIADSSLTAIDEPGLSGLAVGPAGINGTHVAEGSLTNTHLSGGTFSVNSVSAAIGSNISISLHGTASATNSISLSTIDDVLYGDVLLSDDTLSIDTGGLKVTSPTFSVNGVSGTMGDNINIPTVEGICDTPSVIHYLHPSYTHPGEQHLCADIRLSDTSLQVLSTGLSGLRIAPGGVSATHISVDTVQTEHISAGVVTSSKIANESVTSAKIEDSAITTDKLNNTSVTTAKIDSGAVTANKIADVNVTSAKIANQAITTAKIDSGAVTANKIADENVTSAKIKDDAVTTAKIADDAVTNAKIATPTFSVNNISADLGGNISISLHGAASATDTITLSVQDDTMFGNINANSVATTHLAPDAVTSAEVADDAIGNEHLQDNAVATDNITDSAVTNSKIATPTFSVNGIQGQLGGNVVVSTQNDPMYLNHSVMASMSASIGTTATTFDTYPLSGCETFTYTIQVKHPEHSEHHRQITNLMVIYDGTDVLLTESGTCSLPDDIANFTAVISGDDIWIQAYHTLSAGNAALKAVRTCFQ